jgi:oxepin-CoA hydrolase/3-oxo-5,6-dehydrosuberyl-CoA semialdehyde dehydrogenase
MIEVQSFAKGEWISPDSSARAIHSAVDGRQIASAGRADLDTRSMLRYARDVGGPALRQLTFHDRARCIKALATLLSENTEPLTQLAFDTGATRADSTVDIDGGIGTLFVFASKARRELPDDVICTDGAVEQLSRNGTFVGQHIYTSKPGVAVHINAFNFPVWGMLEKMAPALLAGMPVIVKPATSTCYVTEACFRLMIDSNILPAGSIQLITGGTGQLLNQLNSQDMVSFTGSAATALQLKSNPHLLQACVPFNAEQDSLNASMLCPDVQSGSNTFNTFINEVCQEMTSKAGQKCTAIRRILVPQSLADDVTEAISARLAAIKIGDPSLESSQMGALVSTAQREEVAKATSLIAEKARLVFGSDQPDVDGASAHDGAFISPMLYRCDDPDNANTLHSCEAFGPVSTVMPYRDLGHAAQLLNLGGGSLVASVITDDVEHARNITLASAAYHGRLYFNNEHSARESTGHGSPLPHMTHGGPGRAGGGEELGGVRSVKHHMQRTAIQGSPNILSSITGIHVNGADTTKTELHPFRKRFGDLQIGETLEAGPRTITLDDIEHFAHFTGDTFYAHMDEEAAKANPFFPGRVAHGYLLLSFAAGLFVDPDPGPVLANTGLDGLSFQKPVSAGDSLSVALTVKRKTKRNDEYGEVRWQVLLFNQDNEQVASYELHTMNAF